MIRKTFQVVDPAHSLGSEGHLLLGQARVQEEDRWRRALAIGILGTVLIHFILLIAFRETIFTPIATTAASGPPMGDVRAAGGGSGLELVEVRASRPPEATPEEVPVPVPTIEPVEVVVPEEVEEPAVEPDPGPVEPPSLLGTGAPGTGGQNGANTGPGTDAGDGQGGGGNADAGASRLIPPTPRGLFIPPPGRPNSARGQEITVWVFVSEAGRVDRNTVRLEPPTSDNRYNQRLIQSVSEWVFDPARQEGRPVPTWYPFQIIL